MMPKCTKYWPRGAKDDQREPKVGPMVSQGLAKSSPRHPQRHPKRAPKWCLEPSQRPPQKRNSQKCTGLEREHCFRRKIAINTRENIDPGNLIFCKKLPNAMPVQKKLGLKKTCLSMGTGSAFKEENGSAISEHC